MIYMPKNLVTTPGRQMIRLGWNFENPSKKDAETSFRCVQWQKKSTAVHDPNSVIKPFSLRSVEAWGYTVTNRVDPCCYLQIRKWRHWLRDMWRESSRCHIAFNKSPGVIKVIAETPPKASEADKVFIARGSLQRTSFPPFTGAYC
jgi:hypothetical protein